jgi:phosphoesterase RecJ-like protein
MSSPQTTRSDLSAVAEAIREHDRFLLAVHENPDGDALGSLLAAKLTLDALGKESVMYLPGQAPLPAEYKFMPLEEVRRELPDDVENRVLFALDCANESRLGPGQEAIDRAPLVLNVDHHHDNTRFGDVNLVVADASSTGEIVRDLLDELGVQADARAGGGDLHRARHRHGPVPVREHDAQGAQAGRSSWRQAPTSIASSSRSTSRSSSRSSSSRAGTSSARRCTRARIVVSYLLKTDFAEVGAASPTPRDHRLPAGGGGSRHGRADPRAAPHQAGRRGGSACAEPDEVDVSAIARASGDGGGHRQAAGFSSSKEIPRSSSSSASSTREARASPEELDPRGRPRGQAGPGPSSFALVRDLRERTGARAGHAGTLDPFATGLLLVLLGRFTKEQNRFVGLDKRYLTEIDLSARTTTGDPEGDVVEELDPPDADELELRLEGVRGEIELPIPAASAVKVGGERAYKLHRQGVAVEMPVRRSTVRELAGRPDGKAATLDVSRQLRDTHPVDRRGPRRALRACAEVGPFSVENADPALILRPDEALSAL